MLNSPLGYWNGLFAQLPRLEADSIIAIAAPGICWVALSDAFGRRFESVRQLLLVKGP
jgi:hypothetical protein